MKKYIIGIVLILMVALAVPAAYGAVSADKQKEINDLNKQILETRKQVIDKYVESGQITAEQGKLVKDRIDQAEKNLQQNGGQVVPGVGLGRCGGVGPGLGCGGLGSCYANGGVPGAGLRNGATPNSF